MSQPEAALYIQPPTLETTVAVHITVNAVWRNGAANDVGLVELALAALMPRPGARTGVRARACGSSRFFPALGAIGSPNISAVARHWEGAGNRVGSVAGIGLGFGGHDCWYDKEAQA